jgi:hypothetical protein
VLAAAAGAGVRDVALEVNAGRPPFGAAARISGDARFEELARLLAAVDPGSRAFVPEAVSLTPSSAPGRIAFALELLAPAPAPGVPAPSPPPRLAAPVVEFGRDPFRFEDIASEPAATIAYAPRGRASQPPAAIVSAPPAPAIPPVRLVGLLRRGATLLAVLAAGARIHVVGVGEAAEGFEVLAVDDDGVTVRDPQGRDLVLRPPTS